MQVRRTDTTTVTLRPLATDDVEFIYRLRSDTTAGLFNGRTPYRYRRQALDFVRAALHEVACEALHYWIVERAGTPVGTICLWNFDEPTRTVEVGYEILPEYRRRGFATAALRTVLEFAGGQARFAAVEAYVHADNAASHKMLRREGFVRTELPPDEVTERPPDFVRLVRKMS